jgi:hypothetical protein
MGENNNKNQMIKKKTNPCIGFFFSDYKLSFIVYGNIIFPNNLKK